MISQVFAVVCVFIGKMSALPTNEEFGKGESSSENEVHPYNFPFVSRKQWRAREPREPNPLTTPVPYVVIHHTYEPSACYNLAECSRAMRSMQDYHVDDRGWNDIGYNFAVGSDGAVYEGRGWDTVGAHAFKFNRFSIGITLIGDWTETLPPAEQLKTAKSLIEAGVELGYIHRNYILVGHRQVGNTVCPGEVLYQEIQHWPHYSSEPDSADQLQNVIESTGNFAVLKK